MANLDFPGLFKGPEVLISSAQNLTNAWADLGAQQYVAGAVAVGIWITLDINDSTNARVRLLGSHTSGGAEFVLPIKTVGASAVLVEGEYFEFNVDADQLMIIGSGLDGVIPYVQVQVMAGAVGVSAGQIDAAAMTTSGRG